MKVHKILIGVLALTSIFLTGCGTNSRVGELPSGGRKIDNSKALMQLATTMTELDKVDNLGLSLNSNINITHEDNKTGEVINQYAKINNINATIKVNGLTSAKSSSEIKASAEFGFNLDVKFPEVIKQKNSKLGVYLANDNLYYDYSKAGATLLENTELPAENVTKFYMPADIFPEGTVFPLFSENFIEETLLKNVDIDFNSIDQLDGIFSAKQYNNDKIAIAIDITPETVTKVYVDELTKQAESMKEMDENFDLEAAKEQINQLAKAYKEEIAETIKYFKATLIFNDFFIEEFSIATDMYIENSKATPLDSTYSWTRLQANFSIKTLFGEDAKVVIPNIDEFKSVILEQ